MDALVHVVRAFESDARAPPRRLGGSAARRQDARAGADPGRPFERWRSAWSASRPTSRRPTRRTTSAEKALFLKMKEGLEAERPLRELELPEEERRRLRSYAFLSEKPVLLVVNLGEGQIRERGRRSSPPRGSSAFAARPGFGLCPVSAPIEAEMSELSRRGRSGVPGGPGPPRARPRPRDPDLLRAPRPHLLPHRRRGRVPGLDDPTGTKAPVAAGTIHSDIERGLHPRRGGGLSTTSSPPARSPRAATRGPCASRGRNTR